MEECNLLPDEKEQLLIDNRNELMAKIRLSSSFWAQLEKYDSIIQSDILDIQAVSANPHTQVYELVEHLRRGTKTRYQGFLQALIDTQQGHILTDVLGEDISQNQHSQHAVYPELNNTFNPPWKDKVRLLKRKAAALSKAIEVTQDFWDSLVCNHVLSHLEVEVFKSGKPSPSDQINGLLEHLKRGNKKTYRGFLYALSETDQLHVTKDILGEDVPDLFMLEDDLQDSMVSNMQTERNQQKIIENTSELTERLTMNDKMWASMVKHGVLSTDEILDLKTKPKTFQISKLLEKLQSGTAHQYNGFIRSLLETNQRGIVTDILEEDAGSSDVTNEDILVTNRSLHEAILNLKKHYNDNLFKSPLHAFSTMSEEIDLQNVYTPLDIIESQHDKKKSSSPIAEDEILKNLKDKNALTLCTGEAGSGKSTLATRLAWLWARQRWKTIKAVIFIEHTVRGSCLKDVIKNSVPGSEVHKALIWDLLNDEPENVLVIVEAFDQFREKSVSIVTQSLITSKATNMLVTVRKDHPCVTPKFHSHFNQHIEVKGFTQEKRVVFAKKLLQEMNCTYDVEGFLETIGGKPNFDTNPLNIMLACQLYAEGTISSKDFEVLTEVDLYSKTEERLVEREILKEEEVDDEELAARRTEALINLHKLAAYILLQQQSSCRKADLDFYEVGTTSPAKVLLLGKRESSTTHGNQSYWVWPHARLQEFDAASAFAKMEDFKESIWLQLIASRPELNPVTKFVSAILGKDEKYEEVNALTTTTILLQGNICCLHLQEKSKKSPAACKEISDVKERLGLLDTNNGFPTTQCQKLPKLSSVCECCGSLFNNSIKLFEHVQYCWVVGLSIPYLRKLYQEIQSSLFPAKDRSEAGTVHLALNSPSDWTKVLDPCEDVNAAIVEVHLTPMWVDGEGLTENDMLQQNITHIIDGVKPVLLHIHQIGILNSLPQPLVHAANVRKYFIHPEKDMWTLWSSDQDAEISQKKIADTPRYAYGMTLDEDELAVYVHRITDMLHIQQEDLKASRLDVHVGYPLTTSYYGPQPEEAPSDWQDVMVHIMKTVQPEQLDIVSSAIEAMGSALTEYFTSAQKQIEHYDVTYIADGSVEFHKMKKWRRQVAGAPIEIYEKGDGGLVISPRHLAEVCKLTGRDIFADTKDIHAIQLLVPKCDVGTLQCEFRSCLKHLVSLCQVDEYLIIQSEANDDGSDLSVVMDDNPSLCIGEENFRVELKNNGRVVNIMRSHISEVHAIEENIDHITMRLQHIQDMLFINWKRKHFSKASITLHIQDLRANNTTVPYTEIQNVVHEILNIWNPKELVLKGCTSDIVNVFHSDVAIQRLKNQCGYTRNTDDVGNPHFLHTSNIIEDHVFEVQENHITIRVKQLRDLLGNMFREERFKNVSLSVNIQHDTDMTRTEQLEVVLYLIQLLQPPTLFLTGCVAKLLGAFKLEKTVEGFRDKCHYVASSNINEELILFKIFETMGDDVLMRVKHLQDVLSMDCRPEHIKSRVLTVHAMNPTNMKETSPTDVEKAVQYIMKTWQPAKLVLTGFTSGIAEAFKSPVGSKERHKIELNISVDKEGNISFLPIFEWVHGRILIRVHHICEVRSMGRWLHKNKLITINITQPPPGTSTSTADVQNDVWFILREWQPQKMVITGFTSEISETFKSLNVVKRFRDKYGFNVAVINDKHELQFIPTYETRGANVLMRVNHIEHVLSMECQMEHTEKELLTVNITSSPVETKASPSTVQKAVCHILKTWKPAKLVAAGFTADISKAFKLPEVVGKMKDACGFQYSVDKMSLQFVPMFQLWLHNGNMRMSMERIQHVMFMRRQREHIGRQLLTINITRDKTSLMMTTSAAEVQQAVNYILNTWKPAKLVVTGLPAAVLGSIKSSEFDKKLRLEHELNISVSSEGKLQCLPIHETRGSHVLMRVNHIEDLLSMKCQREHRKKDLLSIDITCPPDGMSLVVEKAVRHILSTWQPAQLVITGYVSAVSGTFKSPDVIKRLRDACDLIFCVNSDGKLSFLPIYETRDDHVLMRVNHIEHVLSMECQMEHTEKYLLTVNITSSPVETKASSSTVQTAVCHILKTWTPAKLVLTGFTSDISEAFKLPEVVNSLKDACGFKYSIEKMSLNFVPMSQLSLHRDDMHMSMVRIQHVMFLRRQREHIGRQLLTIDITQDETSLMMTTSAAEVQQAVSYILNTWKPAKLVVTGLPAAVLGTIKSSEFVKKLRHEHEQNFSVSSEGKLQCLPIYESKGSNVLMRLNRIEDVPSMECQMEHRKRDLLRIDITCPPDDMGPAVTEGEKAVRHILSTWQPVQLEITGYTSAVSGIFKSPNVTKRLRDECDLIFCVNSGGKLSFLPIYETRDDHVLMRVNHIEDVLYMECQMEHTEKYLLTVNITSSLVETKASPSTVQKAVYHILKTWKPAKLVLTGLTSDVSEAFKLPEVVNGLKDACGFKYSIDMMSLQFVPMFQTSLNHGNLHMSMDQIQHVMFMRCQGKHIKKPLTININHDETTTSAAEVQQAVSYILNTWKPAKLVVTGLPAAVLGTIQSPEFVKKLRHVQELNLSVSSEGELQCLPIFEIRGVHVLMRVNHIEDVLSMKCQMEHTKKHLLRIDITCPQDDMGPAVAEEEQAMWHIWKRLRPAELEITGYTSAVSGTFKSPDVVKRLRDEHKLNLCVGSDGKLTFLPIYEISNDRVLMRVNHIEDVLSIKCQRKHKKKDLLKIDITCPPDETGPAVTKVEKAVRRILSTWQPAQLEITGYVSALSETFKSKKVIMELRDTYGYDVKSTDGINHQFLIMQWEDLTLKSWAAAVVVMITTWIIVSTLVYGDGLPAAATFLMWAKLWQWQKRQWMRWHWALTLMVAVMVVPLMGQIGLWQRVKQWLIIVVAAVIWEGFPWELGIDTRKAMRQYLPNNIQLGRLWKPQLWLVTSAVGIITATCEKCWWNYLYVAVQLLIFTSSLTFSQHISTHVGRWLTAAPYVLCATWFLFQFVGLRQSLWILPIACVVVRADRGPRTGWHIVRLVLIVISMSFWFHMDYLWWWLVVTTIAVGAELTGRTDISFYITRMIWYMDMSELMRSFYSVHVLCLAALLCLQWLERRPWWRPPVGWLTSDWMIAINIAFSWSCMTSCSECWVRWLVLPAAFLIDQFRVKFLPQLDSYYI